MHYGVGYHILCHKLSNSGDTLKILVPNNVWKYISGWTNHSGTVISQDMIESVMGYRGSKSVIYASHESIIVKEQRVDGSCIGVSISNPPMLRCILMGLERDYQSKVLSKSLNRYYYTSVTQPDTSQNYELKLDPDFVSGFIDGEGSFSVTFIKDKYYKSGWQIKTFFSTGLHKKDLALLEKM